MGWLFTAAFRTKSDQIQDLKRQFGDSLVSSRWGKTGQAWYALLRTHDGGTAICQFLVAKNRNFGWGYKDVGEEMGPCLADCPVSLIDMAGPPPNEHAEKWREACRAFGEAAQRVKKLDPKPGDKLVLKPGCTPSEGIYVGRDGNRFLMVVGWMTYHVKPRLVAEIVRKEDLS